MPTLKTHTLGCKVNQYETEYLREGLQGIGYEDAAGDEPADLCVINTCTVTSEGDSKSRQIIRRMARENPASKIVVMGCYATRAPEEVASLPNVTEVLTDKRELPDLLGRFGVTDVPTGISGFGRRQRAYVKVQDGCLLRCSFCIIPHVRPQLTSRPQQHILDEVRRLVADNVCGREKGYREVVLTGIHLGHYGVDWNRLMSQGKPVPKEKWTRLSHLVRSIAELPGDFRIRLSSIEATEVTRELIGVMQDHPEKVCLSAPAYLDAKRQRRCAAPHAPPLGQSPVRRSLPAPQRKSRSSGDHNRHHRRFSRRNRRRVRRNVQRRPRSRIF